MVKLKVYNQSFSWLGSQNNTPDIMIKGGDAIEVKKSKSAKSSLALNSSCPKANLRHTSPMITKECKGFGIIEVEVKDPNNPAKLIKCKLIT